MYVSLCLYVCVCACVRVYVSARVLMRVLYMCVQYECVLLDMKNSHQHP